MSMNVRSTQPKMALPEPVPSHKQPLQDLGKALQARELAAAKQAFTKAQQHPGAGAPLQRDNHWVQVGRALQSNDLDGARAAFTRLTQSSRGQHARSLQPPIVSHPPLAPNVPPAASTTGGSAGSVLNIVA